MTRISLWRQTVARCYRRTRRQTTSLAEATPQHDTSLCLNSQDLGSPHSQNLDLDTSSRAAPLQSRSNKQPDFSYSQTAISQKVRHTGNGNSNSFVNSNGNGLDLKRFLEEVGANPKEARFWLKHFQQASEPQQPFAVVSLEPELLENPEMLETFASNLAFLHRHDMKCVLLHGTSSPADFAPSSTNMQRVLSELTSISIQLTTLLEKHGAPARPLFASAAFQLPASSSSDSVDSEQLSVNTRLLHWALQSQHIPIVQSLVQCGSGQLLALDTTASTQALATALTPRKVLFINTSGGITNEKKEVIANINLPCDMGQVCNEPWCTPEVKSKVKFISSLLEKLPSQRSAVITSASALLTELFTHHGSGTFFKIMENIQRHRNLKEVDCKKLRNLIQRAFKAELCEGYFSNLESRLHTLFVFEDYSGAAIITHCPRSDVPYLDKFVVLTSKQGESSGQMLWDEVRKDFPQLYWRSRVSNNINSWYLQRCVGSRTIGMWTVFWYGDVSNKTSLDLIDSATSQPSSFKAPGDVGPSLPQPKQKGAKVAFGK